MPVVPPTVSSPLLGVPRAEHGFGFTGRQGTVGYNPQQFTGGAAQNKTYIGVHLRLAHLSASFWLLHTGAP